MNDNNKWKLVDAIMERLPEDTRKNVPNTLTITRLIGSIAIVATLPTMLYTNPILLGTLTALTGITDMLDGKIARRYNCQSTLGGILDAMADKVLTWGIGITLIAMNALTPLVLLVGIRDVAVGYQDAKHKIKTGKELRKNEKKTNNKFKELKKDFAKGEYIPPTILGKVKMWALSSTVCSAIFFAANPTLSIITNSLLSLTGLIASADIILNAKQVKEAGNNFFQKQKEETKTIELKEQLKKKDEPKTKIKPKTNYPQEIIDHVNALANSQIEETPKHFYKDKNSN